MQEFADKVKIFAVEKNVFPSEIFLFHVYNRVNFLFYLCTFYCSDAVMWHNKMLF